ncbi:MAG: tetratricopeptide repeat protein [Micropepsaceae bacterium]
MQLERASIEEAFSARRSGFAKVFRQSLLALMGLLSIALAMPASADVAECERAYQLGRKDEAIKLCRRAAWQENDFFAQVKLGDIYAAKREDDKGYYDPVEAYVWYFMAAHNSAIFDHFHLDAAAEFVVSKLANAENDAEGIYKNLLQDERIDARNRIMYIAACRGGDGFILLGQLQDPYIVQRHSASTGPLSGVVADSWVHVRRPGGVYSRKVDSYNPYASTTPTGYPGSGSYKTSYDFWVNKLCTSSDWFGWLMPNSCSRYSTAVEGSPTAFQTSTIESMVFYLLAERAGHPVAKQYIEALKGLTTGTGADPKAAGNELLAKAKAKAQTWLAPFEFYAAETRYRGETPSGLVHGDECPINLQRERALAKADRLSPIGPDMLRAIGFLRGGGSQEVVRAISKYQDMLGDPQTGQFTPLQLTRLVQIMAVRGNVRAQRCLGIMYIKGVGVPVNFVRAEKWLLLAAEQGDGEAMYSLAELYTQGADGVEKSEDRAVRYRQGAAVAGFEPTRSEFLRLLETAPSASREECHSRRCRRERDRESEANAAANSQPAPVPNATN